MIEKHIVTLKSHWPGTIYIPGTYRFKTIFHYWAKLNKWKRKNYVIFICKDNTPLNENNTPVLNRLVFR